jgi:hypothetical protein
VAVGEAVLSVLLAVGVEPQPARARRIAVAVAVGNKRYLATFATSLLRAGGTPTPQEKSFFVEQASCLFLSTVQDVSNKRNVDNMAVANFDVMCIWTYKLIRNILNYLQDIYCTYLRSNLVDDLILFSV